VKVTAGAARRFLVARHLLAPVRSLEGGPDAVLEVFRRLGSVQFDPLAVAGRSHDLVLHARVAGYDPAWCDLLYERREIFEAYNKGLSLVPASEFAWFRGNLSRNSPRTLAENPDVAAQVLERIRAEGPMSSLDFERERGATTDWFGMPIVFRDRFVGRIEPRIDRDEARVQVLDVWWEDGFSPRRVDGFVDAMRDALRAYLGFAGADMLAWASHLGTEKRLFLTQP
jgi:uncharacterized protein YcaQ